MTSLAYSPQPLNLPTAKAVPTIADTQNANFSRLSGPGFPQVSSLGKFIEYSIRDKPGTDDNREVRCYSYDIVSP